MINSALLLIFPAAMAFAGAMDLFTMTIPNRISLVLLALFGVVVLAAGLPSDVIASHLSAGVLMLAVGLLMFALGWVGGGDAKILAVGALWLGFENLPAFLLFTGIFGSVLTIFLLNYRGYPANAFPLPDWALRLHRQETGLPYGIAIAASALLVFPDSMLFHGLVL